MLPLNARPTSRISDPEQPSTTPTNPRVWREDSPTRYLIMCRISNSFRIQKSFNDSLCLCLASWIHLICLKPAVICFVIWSFLWEIKTFNLFVFFFNSGKVRDNCDLNNDNISFLAFDPNWHLIWHDTCKCIWSHWINSVQLKLQNYCQQKWPNNISQVSSLWCKATSSYILPYRLCQTYW